MARRASFRLFTGKLTIVPAEIAEARYGVTVDYLSFHDDEGGAGLHRGGKGVRIDYRIRSDNAWLTVAYTRDRVPPWPLKGGQTGSPNHIVIRRANGEKERYSVVSGLTLNTDDVIQVMTGTGAGWGDPMKRDPGLGERGFEERLHHRRTGRSTLRACQARKLNNKLKKITAWL